MLYVVIVAIVLRRLRYLYGVSVLASTVALVVEPRIVVQLFPRR
jgi:hypothetical protein